ncbi:serine hydrolase domain-containing protein [Nocardia sp. NPDC005825]|uniref:serine hydrolase domain-containing protein n=1 Tax=unclassified Nocardia TaxID=2637762 RepID=UPI0033F1E0B4
MIEVHADRETSMVIESRFVPLAEKFFRTFRSRRSGGGALAVFQHGRPVLDIWTGVAEPGRPWRRDTMAMSYSTGKGVAATVIHRLADRGLLDYDRPVAEYWPEFAAAGKEFITVRDLLNHRAGLHRVRGLITGDAFLDHDTMAAALASARPDPRRLRSQGYHTVTFGPLVTELAQRVTGVAFPDLVRTELAKPLGTEDFWFRVPPEHRHRIAPLSPTIRVAGFDFETFAARARHSRHLNGLVDSIPEGLLRWQNHPAVHDVVQPGWNGVFTARALAKMYAALANNGVIDGTPFLTPEATAHIARMPRGAGRDYILNVSPSHWLGYHRPLNTMPTPGLGHYGTGGSGGLAFPDLGLSIAFVTNHLGSRLFAAGDFRLAGFTSMAYRLAGSPSR